MSLLSLSVVVAAVLLPAVVLGVAFYATEAALYRGLTVCLCTILLPTDIFGVASLTTEAAHKSV